jgi:hypothetical protein
MELAKLKKSKSEKSILQSKSTSQTSLFSDTKNSYVAPEENVLPHMPPYASQYRQVV